MKSFLITFGIVFIFITLIIAFSSGKGIVTLDNYPEAVAFCGNEIEHVVFTPDKASIRFDEENNITFVINKGHEKDMEVVELMAIAKIQCSQYDELDQ